MTLPPDWRKNPYSPYRASPWEPPQKPVSPMSSLLHAAPRFPPIQPMKRKVFISYHHELDQGWADHFSDQFSESFEVFCDRSLDEEIDSDDPEYINRVIREDYITGASVTIVLCGQETGKRKFVDWEIHSTLHHQHALLGIIVPGTQPDPQGLYAVPTRLHHNIVSRYAHFLTAWPQTPAALTTAIEEAIRRSKNMSLLKNDMEMMRRNLL